MAFFPIFHSFFPEGIAERTFIIQLAVFSRYSPGGAVLFFVGSLPRFNRFTKSEKAFYFSKHFFCIRHQGRGCRFRRRIPIGSFRQILAVGRNRAENESQKNCSCQISHNFILLNNFPNNDNAIYFEKTKCQGEKINVGQSRVRSVILFIDATAKNRPEKRVKAFLLKGKTFYGMKLNIANHSSKNSLKSLSAATSLIRQGVKKCIVFGFRSCFSWESHYISYCHFMENRQQVDAICPVGICI